jgi:hypothetical protein
MLIKLPTVDSYTTHFIELDLTPELPCHLVCLVASNEVDEPLAKPINSNPYPAVIDSIFTIASP